MGEIDRKIRRSLKFLKWIIDGQSIHGISLVKYPNLTPERVEELYNVNFGN